MRSTKFAALAVVGLLALMVTVPASAQVRATLKADVPFEFVASGKTVPAGEYILVLNTSSVGLIEIMSADYTNNIFALTQRVESASTPDHAKLVFNKYGNQYFLSQIWSGEGRSGLQLPKSRIELELGRTASNFQTVTIVAQLLARR